MNPELDQKINHIKDTSHQEVDQAIELLKQHQVEILNHPELLGKALIDLKGELISNLDSRLATLNSEPLKPTTGQSDHSLSRSFWERRSMIAEFGVGTVAGGAARIATRATLAVTGGLAVSVIAGGVGGAGSEYGKQVFRNIKETISREDRLTKSNSTFRQRMARAAGDFYHISGGRLARAGVIGAFGGALGFGVVELIDDLTIGRSIASHLPNLRGAAEAEWFKNVARTEFGDKLWIDVNDGHGNITWKELDFTDMTKFDPKDGYWRAAYDMAVADKQGVGFSHDLAVLGWLDYMHSIHSDILIQDKGDYFVNIDNLGGSAWDNLYSKEWYRNYLAKITGRSIASLGNLDLNELKDLYQRTTNLT